MKISKISLGVRHRRYFKLPEIAGEIVDYILSNSAPVFGKDFFIATDAITNGVENKGRILYGSDNITSVTVDSDSIIVNYDVKNLDEGLEKFKTDIAPFLQKIFKNFDIRNINRVGMLFEFENIPLEKFNDMTKAISSDTFKKPEIFTLRFSEKEADLLSLAQKDLLDYANNIIAISKNEETTQAKFDYQFYYSPEINSINDVDFTKFIEVAKSKLENKFFAWINLKNEK